MSNTNLRPLHYRGLFLAGSVLIAISTSQTIAQDKQPSARFIEEIIVTATRREESAQTVSVSVTVLSDIHLAEQGFNNMRDLTMMVPGLRTASTGGADTSDFSLRGLRRIPFSESPPAVVSYFSDVPMPAEGAQFNINDLESIQVLKGPQGTLFGRNTIGGAILLTPKKPVYNVEGYIKAGVGDYNLRRLEGAINVPLVDDKVALRFAGQTEKRDGYVENSGLGGDWNDKDNYSYRVSLLVEPNEWFSNLSIYDYYEHKEGGTSAVPVVNVDNPFGLDEIATSILANICGSAFIPDTTLCNYNDAFDEQQRRGAYSVELDTPPISDAEIWGFTNKTDISLGEITLRNIFGYREVENFTSLDSDGLTLTLPLLNIWGATGLNQITDELQLLGYAFDDRMDWLIGAFYLKSEQDGTNGLRLSIIAPTNWDNTYFDRKNEAVFANMGYQITDKLKIKGGYRVTRDESSVCAFQDSGAINFRAVSDQNDCLQNPSAFKLDSERKKNETWTMGLDYQWNEETFLYAVSRRGTREGSFNAPDLSGSIFEQYQTFGPEKITDFELGVKSDWQAGDINGRLNLAAFTMKHENIQSSLNVAAVKAVFDADPTQFGHPVGSIATNPAAGSIGVNGGEVRIDGFDLELLVLPTDELKLSVMVGYAKTNVEEQIPSPFPGMVDTPNLISPTPELSYTLSARYETPIDVLKSNLILNGSYYWSDSMLFGTDYEAPGYKLTNLRAELNDINGTGVSIGAYVNNVFDEEYYFNAASGVNSLGFYTANVGEPRMWGLEIHYEFGQD